MTFYETLDAYDSFFENHTELWFLSLAVFFGAILLGFKLFLLWHKGRTK